ncbi:MAG: hypothetical protein ABUS56_10815, partial [Acidobacteriota bacterium]
MRLGVDAQFATYKPRAGLFVHHLQLLRALQALGGVETALFLNRYGLPPERQAAIRAEVSAAMDGAPTHLASVPGRLQGLRMRLSPLGRLDVFYHVFGGTFGPIPGLANVFLVPDLIPLAV